MNTYKPTITILLTLVLLTSCKPNYEKIFKQNNDTFELHRTTLNNVIIEIENKFISNWNGRDYVVPIDSMSKQTKTTLKNLGIGSVEISGNPNDSCKKNYWITLNVIDKWNISSLRVVQLVFAPCDENAIRNHHYYDGYHRDFWGQGDNWFIYSDTDFI